MYARYEPTEAGRARKGSIETPRLPELVRLGLARFEGLRYEDFLPVSAAGIFASNLNQYGTKSTAAVRPTYTQAMLEEIMGKRIVDADAVYKAMQARSILDTHTALGTLRLLAPTERAELEAAAETLPEASRFKESERVAATV